MAASVKFKMVKTSTKVPTISPIKLKKVLRIAGAVQKTAFFVAPSLVASKWFLYTSQTIKAPSIAPSI